LSDTTYFTITKVKLKRENSSGLKVGPKNLIDKNVKKNQGEEK
jgi:hypothetical protein